MFVCNGNGSAPFQVSIACWMPSSLQLRLFRRSEMLILRSPLPRQHFRIGEEFIIRQIPYPRANRNIWLYSNICCSKLLCERASAYRPHVCCVCGVLAAGGREWNNRQRWLCNVGWLLPGHAFWTERFWQCSRLYYVHILGDRFSMCGPFHV